MSRTEFIRGLREELEGKVSAEVIQENVRYYDSYIAGEAAKGTPEEEVIEALGGPRIIARTIVDAAYDTEDRPDGFETYGAGSAQEETEQRDEGPQSFYQETYERQTGPSHIHYIDFSKWYVRLLAGLAVFLIIFLILTLFLGAVSLLWPVILIVALVYLFRRR